MEQQAFLNAIAARPADDAPRLVYADWLDEHDQPDRAELLRRQVHLARRPFWDAGYTSEAIACAALVNAHPEWTEAWREHLPRSLEVFAPDTPVMQRGFVNLVELPAAEFIERKDVSREHPFTRVNLKCEESLPGPKKTWQAFSDLREVDFSFISTANVARKMLTLLEYWPHLTHFGIRGSRLPADEALELFQHPHTANVESLTIGGSPLSPAVEDHLIRRPLPNLRHLKRVWVPDLAWLQAPWMKSLEALHILDSGNRLTLADMGTIIDHLPGSALRMLQLGEWNFTPKDCHRLATALSESSIAYLAIRHTRLAASQVADILATQPIPSLRGLALTGLDVDAALIAALASSVGPQLRVLWLNSLNSEALPVLADSPSFANVESLRLGLRMMQRTDAVPLRMLFANRAWRNVRSLTLYSATDYSNQNANVARFTPHLLEHVVQSPAADHIEELRLDLLGFNDDCATILNDVATWPALRLLVLRLSDTSGSVHNTLRERFGSRLRVHSNAAYM